MTRRLLFSYLTVTAIVLIVLEVPFGAFVAGRQRAELVTGLERDALILATIYEDALDRDAPYSPQPALTYSENSGTRVVVTDVDGVSIVDSGAAPNADFTNRVEIRRALDGEIVSGRRRSETLGRDLLYVAVPVASGGSVYGAVRITTDPADVEANIYRFWWTLAGIAVIVMAAMTLVGLVVARSTTRPVTALRDAAIRAGRGDLDVRIDPGDAPPELSDLAERFNEMAGRLSGLIERQRTFVADASHQLRTPLTALRLRLENLEQSVGEADETDVRAALTEVERLTRLVDQLLMLARADRSPKATSVDLSDVSRERVALWSAVAADHGVSLEINAPATVAAEAIPDAVEQILDNLIENALAVSSPGSTIEIGVSAEGPRARIAVADDGPGMTEEELDRAFDRFWRKDSGADGTGLGLAIARGLAERSGGTLTLAAPRSGGVVATLELRRPDE